MNIEEQILGGCILNDEALETVTSILTTDDFTGTNKSVFDAIKKVKESGKNVSIVTIQAYFNNSDYLLKLTDSVVSIRKIRFDCYELKEIRQKETVQGKLKELTTSFFYCCQFSSSFKMIDHLFFYLFF